MGNPIGFLNIDRKNHRDEDALTRIEHWKEFHIPMADAEVAEQASRCMDCGVPFCHKEQQFSGATTGCPINNLIPDWNDMVYRNQWEQALKLLLKTNNFPEFTGRVCPAPCEGSCVLGINEPPVTIKNHEYSIIEKAFENGWIKPNPPSRRSDKSVAVFGSGSMSSINLDTLLQCMNAMTVLAGY